MERDMTATISRNASTGTMKRSGSLRFDTGRLRRNIQKHISRTKEKVLHNLDKGEKTDDELIKRSEAIITKKQASTVKLQTELKRHLKSLKNVSASSRSLHETMLEAYEDNWAGRKEFGDALVNLDSCWLIYFNTLCTVLEQVGSHVDEFVTLKDKMEKRKRKLIDYNLAKRNLHLTNSSKKRDDAKIRKAKRELEFVEAAYFELNAELRRELPIFYESHIHFCCENWSYLLENEKQMYESICTTVQAFIMSLNQLRLGHQKSEYHLSGVELSYSEISRSSVSLAFDHRYSNGDLYETLDGSRPRLSSDTARSAHTLLPGAYGVQRHASAANCFESRTRPSVRCSSVDNIAGADDADGYGTIDFRSRSRVSGASGFSNRRLPDPVGPRPPSAPASDEDIYNADHHIYAMPNKPKKAPRPDAEAKLESAASSSVADEAKLESEAGDADPGGADEVYADISASSASSSLSSRLASAARSSNSSPRPEKGRRSENLPMMIAVHPYAGQDEDELDLEVDDLVQVMPWENESLKEDGWLFGMKLPDGKKGLFPENHTTAFVT